MTDGHKEMQHYKSKPAEETAQKQAPGGGQRMAVPPLTKPVTV